MCKYFSSGFIFYHSFSYTRIVFPEWFKKDTALSIYKVDSQTEARLKN